MVRQAPLRQSAGWQVIATLLLKQNQPSGVFTATHEESVGVVVSKLPLRKKSPNRRLANHLCPRPQYCGAQALGLQINVFHCCSLNLVSIGAVLSEVWSLRSNMPMHRVTQPAPWLCMKPEA